MAISATFELRETPGSVGSVIYGMALKSYTVVDLDYTLKRSFDKTGRPSSGASIDLLKVTIRGVKEVTAKFHEWIQSPDKLMDGTIKIYDSTGYATTLSQDFTGGDTADYLGEAEHLATKEMEDELDYSMDKASKYRLNKDDDKDKGENLPDDIFNEMDRDTLLNYIASKNLDVQVRIKDSDDTIRSRIRYAIKINNMTYDELKAEAAAQGITDLPQTPKKEDYQRELLKYNSKDDKTDDQKKKAKEDHSRAESTAYKTVDNLKKATSKTVSSAASRVTKTVLESARSITFKNAYCVSLREHFHGDPDNKGTLDSSYPWLIEICIRPGKLEVNGWNVAGGSAKDVVFDFFNF